MQRMPSFPGIRLMEFVDIVDDLYPAIGDGFQEAIALFLRCALRLGFSWEMRWRTPANASLLCTPSYFRTSAKSTRESCHLA